MGRLTEALSLPDPSRTWALWGLSEAVRTGLTPLEASERLELARALRDSSVVATTDDLWRLAVESPHPELEQVALDTLATPGASARDCAFQYLAAHNTSFAATALERFRSDPDPGVLYEVARLLSKRDKAAAVDMMIDILPRAKDHELGEALEMEIIERGGPRHLLRLCAAGGPSVRARFRVLRRELSKRLCRDGWRRVTKALG